MYAVIETGGKQYRVEVGTELAVELLDVEPGQDVTIKRVLLVADGEEAAIGRPTVADASVSATVLRNDRAAKVIAFKYKPKARRRVKKGHRQEQTVLRITDVRIGAKSAAAAASAAAEAAKTERERLEEAAARQAAADAALAAKLAETAAERAAERAARAAGAAGSDEPAKKPARGRAKAVPDAETESTGEAAPAAKRTRAPKKEG